MKPEEIVRLREYKDDQEQLAHHIDMAYRELRHARKYVGEGIKVPAQHKLRLGSIMELAGEILERDRE